MQTTSRIWREAASTTAESRRTVAVGVSRCTAGVERELTVLLASRYGIDRIVMR